MRKVAPGTHNWDSKKGHLVKQCKECHQTKVLSKMKKCSTCKLIVCLNCEKNITRFCEDFQGKRPKDKIRPGIPQPIKKEPGDFMIQKSEVVDWTPVGEGTWGKVYKARYHGWVAVKKLKCKNPDQDKVRLQLLYYGSPIRIFSRYPNLKAKSQSYEISVMTKLFFLWDTSMKPTTYHVNYVLSCIGVNQVFTSVFMLDKMQFRSRKH